VSAAPPSRVPIRTLPLDFWCLWSVGLIAAVVRWLETVVVGIVVYQQTSSAFIVAAITMLRMLPTALVGAFLGAFAERVDRRLTLAMVMGLLAVTSATMAILAWTGALAVWHMAVASLLSGLGWVTDNPVRRVLMGESVGRDRMATAMALDVGAGSGSRMAGPMLGGFLLAGIGIEGAFLLGAALYAAALAATFMVRTRIAPVHGAGDVLARTRDGFAIVLADRRLAAAMVVTIIYNLFGWPFTSMIPVIGRDQLSLGPQGVGLLASIDGVGAFAGALCLAWWLTPRWHARAYVGGVFLYLIGVIVFALAPHTVTASLALLLTGLAGAAFATLQATIVYLAAPPDMRSRILGVLAVCIGTGPIGFLWLGWLAHYIGAPHATALTGAMGLLALAATYRLWRQL
jgi:MFS family permease